MNCSFYLKIAVSLIIFGGQISLATIIHVPANYPTIQTAINSAQAGDTVLVAEGIYAENLNFNGKVILLASNFILTGNTATISATIIDGSGNGSVVTFNSGEDYSARLVGFTIRNGNSYNGGGIYCSGSHPTLDHLIVTENFAQFGGGGIACQYDSNPIIINSRITGNTAEHGGGIWIGCDSSTPIIGMADNRCNIYGNLATNEYGLGAEIQFCVGTGLQVRVSSNFIVYADTFSVLNPDESLVSPVNLFVLDINAPYYPPVSADVYVSPAGDNSNDGLTPSTPFLNIWYAILRVVSSPVDTFKIHILPGIYSPSLTGERPLHPKNYVSLVGEDSSSTIIDGELQMCLIYCYQDSQLTISNLTLKNGDAPQGAGIYCEESSPTITENIIINNGDGSGGTGYEGGIYCVNNSSPVIQNNRIASNFSYGIYCTSQSNAIIANNRIIGNLGGGIICSFQSNATIINNSILGDSLGSGSGIVCEHFSNGLISDNTISGNQAGQGGGILCRDSNPTIANNTITNNISIGGEGGGIYCHFASPEIDGNIISNNSVQGNGNSGSGGGIYCENFSNPIITNNTITGNVVIDNKDATSVISRGGGIYMEDSYPVIGGSFGNGNLFQNNTALAGPDIYSEDAQNIINAQYNTFTIYPVSSYYVRRLADFDLSNGTGLNSPISQDLYVSPSGSNQNDGLTPQTPLLNIQFALSRILPSPSNALTIHLATGTYSPSVTGEVFPLPMMSYVSLEGNGPDSCIIDADSSNRIIYCLESDSLVITGLRIQGGKASSGAGIYCESSNLTIFKNAITGNSAFWGSGIYCTTDASPTVANNMIAGNKNQTSPYYVSIGGGLYVDDNSNPLIINNIIVFNSASDWAGGIGCENSSNPNIINNTIYGNDGGITEVAFNATAIPVPRLKIALCGEM